MKNILKKTLLLGTTMSLVAIGAYVPISKASEDVTTAISQYSEMYWDDIEKTESYSLTTDIQSTTIWSYDFGFNGTVVSYDLNIKFDWNYLYTTYSYQQGGSGYWSCTWYENGYDYESQIINFTNTDSSESISWKTYQFISSCTTPSTDYYSGTLNSTFNDSIFTISIANASGSTEDLYDTFHLREIDGTITYTDGSYDLQTQNIDVVATEDKIEENKNYYTSTNTYQDLENDIIKSLTMESNNNINSNIDVVFLDENNQEIPESEEPNKYLTTPYIDFYVRPDGTDSRVTGQTEIVYDMFIPYFEFIEIKVVDQTDTVNDFSNNVSHELVWNKDINNNYYLMNNDDISIEIDVDTAISTDESVITQFRLVNPWNSTQYENLSGGLDGTWYLETTYQVNSSNLNTWQQKLFINPDNLTEMGITFELIYDNNPNNTITWTYYQKQDMDVSSDHVLTYTDSSTGVNLSWYQGFINDNDKQYVNAYSNMGITNVSLMTNEYELVEIYKYNETSLTYELYSTISYGETQTLSSSGLYKIVAYDEDYGNEYVEYLDLFTTPSNQHIYNWNNTPYYNTLLDKAISLGYTQELFDNASYYQLYWLENI